MGTTFGDLNAEQKAEFAAIIHSRHDAWMNLITGLGSARDKRTAARFTPDAYLDPQTLTNLYEGDDMAAKAVEMIVVDALAKGFELTSSDAADAGKGKDDADGVMKLLDDLDVEDKIAEGATWGRLYGAGGVLLGVNDGKKPTEELVDDDVKSLDFLTTFEVRDLFVEAYYSDKLRGNYGQPMIYRVEPVSGASSLVSAVPEYVHASRLLMFDGVRTTRRTKLQRQGWSLSVLQRLYEILRDANSNWASTTHLMTDANLAVIKIKGLLELIAAKDTQEFQTRMEIADMAKSVARAYPVDADTEDYHREPTSFAGYPEILDRTYQRLAAAMPETTPVTRLLGMSPAGMNSTGESDERVWVKSVEGYQRKKLKRPIERVARLAARALNVGEPDSLCVKFPPYRQLTAIEEAQRRKTVADTDVAYITAGVWHAEEVTIARTKGGEYSADPPVVDIKLRERALGKELAAHEENAGKPDPTPPSPSDLPDGTEGGQAHAGGAPAAGDQPVDGTGAIVE